MWTRREVLQALGAGAGLAAPPSPLRTALAAEAPDLVLRLTAAPGTAGIRPGDETAMLRYTGQVPRVPPEWRHERHTRLTFRHMHGFLGGRRLRWRTSPTTSTCPLARTRYGRSPTTAAA